MKNITEILSSFDKKFPSYLDGDSVTTTWWRFSNPSSRDLPRELKIFLKDSIAEILDGIPCEEMIQNEFTNDEHPGEPKKYGYNTKSKELREYIEEVRL